MLIYNPVLSTKKRARRAEEIGMSIKIGVRAGQVLSRSHLKLRLVISQSPENANEFLACNSLKRGTQFSVACCCRGVVCVRRPLVGRSPVASASRKRKWNEWISRRSPDSRQVVQPKGTKNNINNINNNTKQLHDPETDGRTNKLSRLAFASSGLLYSLPPSQMHPFIREYKSGVDLRSTRVKKIGG